MAQIFIFGFDTYYPQGGLSDLVCMLHEENGEHCGPDMLIKPEVLVQTLLRRNASRDYYQVVQFNQNGGVLLMETWHRRDKAELKSRPYLQGSKTIAYEYDDMLTLTGVKSEFEDKQEA